MPRLLARACCTALHFEAPQNGPSPPPTHPPPKKKNNGACSEDGLKCVCPPGFFGLHCQNDDRDAFADFIPRKYVPDWAIALIVFASLLAVAAVALLAFFVARERRGRPYFKSWQQGAAGVEGAL